MIRVGEEVLPDDGVHPEGTLVDEVFVGREVVEHTLEVAISHAPDPVSNLPPGLVGEDVVLEIARQEHHVSQFEVLGP